MFLLYRDGHALVRFIELSYSLHLCTYAFYTAYTYSLQLTTRVIERVSRVFNRQVGAQPRQEISAHLLGGCITKRRCVGW